MNSSGSSSTSSVRQRASASAPQMLPPAQDDLRLEGEPDASLAQGVVEVREHEVLVELSLPVRRAEEPDARLEMLLALRVREGRLRVAVVAELLGGLEHIDAHRGEEPDGGVVAGDDLAHAPVDLVQKLLVERDEQAQRAVARLVAERRVDLGDAVDLDSQKPAAVLAVAAVVDGGHERADVAQPRGQVGVLGYAPVRDDAGDERGDAGVRVPVQAEGAALADHEGARRVAGAVLGGEMVGLSLEELPCALQVGREVVGMDVLAPDLGRVLEVGRGYAEVGDGVGGPA